MILTACSAYHYHSQGNKPVQNFSMDMKSDYALKFIQCKEVHVSLKLVYSPSVSASASSYQVKKLKVTN